MAVDGLAPKIHQEQWWGQKIIRSDKDLFQVYEKLGDICSRQKPKVDVEFAKFSPENEQYGRYQSRDQEWESEVRSLLCFHGHSSNHSGILNRRTCYS